MPYVYDWTHDYELVEWDPVRSEETIRPFPTKALAREWFVKNGSKGHVYDVRPSINMHLASER